MKSDLFGEPLRGKETPHAKPFVYDGSGLAALSESTRTTFDRLLTRLVEAAVGLLADEFSEAEFMLASEAFHRQIKALFQEAVIGEPKWRSSRRLSGQDSGWMRELRKCRRRRKSISRKHAVARSVVLISPANFDPRPNLS